MKVDIDIKGLDGVLDLLKSLPPEIVSKRGGPVKLALAKGARLIRQQVDANLVGVTQGVPTHADKVRSTGFLRQNLIATRGKEPVGSKGERYLVRFRRKPYPDGHARVVQVAQLLEYGSSQQPAEPFIRPAFQSKAQEAIDVISEDLVQRVNRVVLKLSKTRPR